MFGLFKFIVSIPIIIAIINPQLAWEMSEGWKFKNAEPSKTYLVMTRVMSVIMLIILWFVIRV